MIKSYDMPQYITKKTIMQYMNNKTFIHDNAMTNIYNKINFNVL